MEGNNQETTQETHGETERRTRQIVIDPEWVVGYFGSRGTGKSTLMLVHMQEVKRAIIYDPIFMNHYRMYETFDFRSFQQMKKRVMDAREDNKKLIVRYVAWDDTDEEFERVSDLVWKCGYPVIFIVEELAGHIHGGNLTPIFYRLIRQGRNRAIGIWFSTQHPKMIPPKVRNNCDALWAFAIYEPDSKKYLQNWIGENYTPERLQKYGFFYWKSGEPGLIPCKPLTLSKRLKQLTSKKITGQYDLNA